MTCRNRLLSAVAAAMLAVGTIGALPAYSDNLETGWAAYQKGDFAAAIGIWSRLADAGNDRALFNLGVMYDEGRGVAQDRAAALDYWRRAAEMGNPQAQHNLGLAHIAGLGVDEDADAAVGFLKKAAITGEIRSQYTLGKNVPLRSRRPEGCGDGL